jgi:hypothetical protein
MNPYRQSMPSRAWLSAPLAATCATVLVLAPALSACGGFRDAVPTKTVTATAAPTTTPTPSKQDAVRAWHNAVLVPLQEMRDAADKIVGAGEVFDLTTMGIACQEQRDAVEQVQQHMPSPDPDLTTPLQKALSDYSAANAICTTAIENHNLDDFGQGATFLHEGNTYWDNAAKILATDLGESPNSAAPQNPSSPSQPAAAVDQLQQLASSDRPYVTANLANRWIPQLSSKSSREPWTVDPENGVTYDPARILQEHRQLRQQYPDVKLLWAGDWSTFSDPNFWVTVAGITFDDSSSALAWCSSQSLDRDHCTAARL